MMHSSRLLGAWRSLRSRAGISAASSSRLSADFYTEALQGSAAVIAKSLVCGEGPQHPCITAESTGSRPGEQTGAGSTASHAPAFAGEQQLGAGLSLGRGQIRHQSRVQDPSKQKRTIAVGISGGVDSAVAAMLLKDQGYDVFGVFMRNWDESEETGNANCTVEADYAQAQSVCRHIGVPLHEVDFVRQYWTHVFSDFVAQCEAGVTPNPDLACNRHIKFGALLEHCKSLGADLVATGHYARIERCTDSGQLQLLRGVDPLKDQSYFLASIHGSCLAEVAFPLGGMTKQHVRQLAMERGIPSAVRQSSTGICFIGRRTFGEFISNYTEPVVGRFEDVTTGQDVGPCANMLAITLGQGSGISGLKSRMYVVGKDMQSQRVYVAPAHGHPSLFTLSAALQDAHWIAGQPPQELQQGRGLACSFKARYRQAPQLCTVSLPSDTRFVCKPSRFTRLRGAWPSAGLYVAFKDSARAITPQQAFVMYQEEVCLGSVPILYPGQTLHEMDNSAHRLVDLQQPEAVPREDPHCAHKSVDSRNLTYAN